VSALAKRVLELDQKYPGDPEASMDLPAKVWAELVELARTDSSSDLLAAVRALRAIRSTTPQEIVAARCEAADTAIAKAEGRS
jgi:hypothetical protein